MMDLDCLKSQDNIDPNKITIIPNSSGHGVSLIQTDELRDEVFNWVKAYILQMLFL